MCVAIARRAREVQAESAQGSQLRVLPIVGESREEPRYRVLDAATLPHVRVTEVSEAGSVPELIVQNALDVRVFLMDGQELIGAKQNRILNTDVLVPATAAVKIPVSCVEQGRWHHTSGSFVAGKAASHRTRSGKQERVRASLRRGGGHDADQAAVWSEVESSLAVTKVSSPTMALSDAYASHQSKLESFRRSLVLPAGSVGVAVFRGTMFLGLDLFDRQATLQYFWDSLVDSYAIEWLVVPHEPTQASSKADDERSAVAAVLERAAVASWESFPSPGEGRDWRMDDAQLVGSALVCGDDAVVHLQVFPKDVAGQTPERRRPRIFRPYGV